MHGGVGGVCWAQVDVLNIKINKIEQRETRRMAEMDLGTGTDRERAKNAIPFGEIKAFFDTLCVWLNRGSRGRE